MQAAAIFDRFAKLRDLLSFFQGVELAKLFEIVSKLRELTDADVPWDTVDGLAARMGTLLEVLTLWSEATENETDDAIALFLGRILINESARKVLAQIVLAILSRSSEMSALSDDELVDSVDQDEVGALGLDVASIVAIARILVQLIQILRG